MSLSVLVSVFVLMQVACVQQSGDEPLVSLEDEATSNRDPDAMQVHHVKDAIAPICARALRFQFLHSFGKYLLVQQGEGLPPCCSIDKKFQVSCENNHFALYNQNKENLGGGGFSLPEYNAHIEYEMFNENLLEFKGKVYVFKRQEIRFKRDPQDKEEEHQARNVIEIWSPKAAAPAFTYHHRLNNIAVSYGNYKDFNDCLKGGSRERVRRGLDLLNRRAHIRALEEWIVYEHVIEKNDELFAETLLLDQDLNVLASRISSFEDKEIKVDYVSEKTADSAGVVRWSVQEKFVKSNQESGLFDSRGDSQIASAIHFDAWVPQGGPRTPQKPVRKRKTIEIYLKVTDLEVKFDTKNRRFYVAGTWNWRNHQNRGFLMALDPEFKVLWQKIFSIRKSTAIKGVSIELDGSVSLVGESGDAKTMIGDAPAFQDLFLARFSETGKFLEAVSFGTNREEKVEYVSVSEAGELLIAGSFDGPNSHAPEPDASLAYMYPLALVIPPGENVVARFKSRVHVRTIEGGGDLMQKGVFYESDLSVLQDGFECEPHPDFVQNAELKRLHEKIWLKLAKAYEKIVEDDSPVTRNAAVKKFNETARKYRKIIPALEFDLTYLKKVLEQHPNEVFILSFSRDFDGMITSDGIRMMPPL